MISDNIRKARKAKGITQQEMAVRLNVVRQTVSKWETGLSIPDADILIKIADLLGVSVNSLLDMEPQNSVDDDLSEELANLNERLADKEQEINLQKQLWQKRSLILFISFTTMLIAMSVKNEFVSVILTGGCMLIALIILYRNLELLTKATTSDIKISKLKLTTIFDVAVVVFVVFVTALDRSTLVIMSESDEKLFAAGIISITILFSGIVCPKLPFNRHTGFRLPWTVRDEDTWNIAHRILGYISLPLVLLYVTVSLTVDNFEAVTMVAVVLWIGIPGLLSLVFYLKKFHRKV